MSTRYYDSISGQWLSISHRRAHRPAWQLEEMPSRHQSLKRWLSRARAWLNDGQAQMALEVKLAVGTLKVAGIFAIGIVAWQEVAWRLIGVALHQSSAL